LALIPLVTGPLSSPQKINLTGVCSATVYKPRTLPHLLRCGTFVLTVTLGSTPWCWLTFVWTNFRKIFRYGPLWPKIVLHYLRYGLQSSFGWNNQIWVGFVASMHEMNMIVMALYSSTRLMSLSYPFQLPWFCQFMLPDLQYWREENAECSVKKIDCALNSIASAGSH